MEKLKKYRYSGPASGVTLADGPEVLLWPGKDVSLPAGHEYVRTLTALGHLTPVDDNITTATSPAPTPKRKNSNDNDVKAEDAHVS